MKSLMIGFVILCMSGISSVVAAEPCHLKMEAGLCVSPMLLEFYGEDKTAYQIKDHHQLIVNGKPVVLDSNQQALVTQYDQQVRAMVPEVREMVLEGIDLAIEGVTYTLDGLLGTRNKISIQLCSELGHLKGDVRRYFDGEVLNFNNHQDVAAEFFGKHFEMRMERILDTSLQESAFGIMVAMGKEVLLAGGDVSAFDERMNRFGKELEAQIQSSSSAIKAHGLSLCKAAQALNNIEDQLRNAIPDMQSMDFIRVDAQTSASLTEI